MPELSEFFSDEENTGDEDSAADEGDAANAEDSRGDDPAADPAVRQALATARNLREWLIQWNTFDKLRARRLGQTNPLHSEPKGAPLR